MEFLLAFLCVVGIAAGQILFKMTANSLQRTGSFFAPETAVILVSALVLYAITTIVWVWVLRGVELSRLYPVMALAFVLVPLASHFAFGERVPPSYFLGAALIAIGIFVTVRD